MADQNMFGGGNAQSLYVPMSEVEQEALLRLSEGKRFRIHILEWGVVNQPRMTFGDARVQFQFELVFNRPPPPGIPVHYFDMELRLDSGHLLFKERQSVLYNGKPMNICAGMVLNLVWDIALARMDPKFVKEVLPGAIGLTSRLTDKDTGDATFTGNMKLSSKEKQVLKQLREGEAKVRGINAKRAAFAKGKADGN